MCSLSMCPISMAAYSWGTLDVVSKFFIISTVAIYFSVVMRQLWCNYDETYGVIYEVIMKTSRASLELFWDLKVSKYVEYLTRVSSE